MYLETLSNENIAKFMDSVYHRNEPKTGTWLDTAKNITTGSRRRDYGHPLINFIRIALYFNSYLQDKLLPDTKVTPLDIAALMVLLKIARQQNTNKDDNWVDIIGYSACVEEMHKAASELGYDDATYFDDLPLDEWTSAIRRLQEMDK